MNYITSVKFKKRDTPQALRDSLSSHLNGADLFSQRVRNLTPEEVIDLYNKSDKYAALKLRYTWELYNLPEKFRSYKVGAIDDAKIVGDRLANSLVVKRRTNNLSIEEIELITLIVHLPKAEFDKKMLMLQNMGNFINYYYFLKIRDLFLGGW